MSQSEAQEDSVQIRSGNIMNIGDAPESDQLITVKSRFNLNTVKYINIII